MTTSWSQVTSGADESWSGVTDTAGVSWSGVTDSSLETWTRTLSDTTIRNTSRFVLLEAVHISATSGVNFQPALRGTASDGRGGSFYLTTTDPITLHSSGESLI